MRITKLMREESAVTETLGRYGTDWPTISSSPPQPSVSSDEARLERLRQLAVDLTRAVDAAEEQRRILGDLADYANEQATGVSRFHGRSQRVTSARQR